MLRRALAHPETCNVQGPSFRFNLEVVMPLSGSNEGGRPQLRAEITSNTGLTFDLFALRGTYPSLADRRR